MAYQVIKKSKNQQGKELINLIFQGKVNQIDELVFVHKHSIASGENANDKACVLTIYGIPSKHGDTQENYKIVDRQYLNLAANADEYIATIIPGKLFDGYVSCWWKLEYDDANTNYFTDLANAMFVFKSTNPITPSTNNTGV